MNQIGQGTLSAIVQSDTVNQPFTLRGLYVFAAGTVVLVTTEDVTLTLTFPAAADGGAYPAFIGGSIKRVNDTSTTLTDALMLGVR